MRMSIFSREWSVKVWIGGQLQAKRKHVASTTRSMYTTREGAVVKTAV